MDILSADTFRFSLQPDTNVRYLQDASIESIITTTDGATLRCTNRDRKRFWSGNRDQKERTPPQCQNLRELYITHRAYINERNPGRTISVKDVFVR